MRVRRLAAGVALAAVIALTGCTQSDDSGTYTPTSGPVAFYPKPSSGLEEKLVGTIAMRDDCFVVESPDGAIHVPVFPANEASWDSSTLTLDGESYTDGDEISVIGGPVAEEYLGPVTYYPTGCDRTKAFFVAPSL